MSIIYTIVLCVVFIAFIAITVEAVLSVSRAKPWPITSTQLALVETVERRTQDLRFIGDDRRVAMRVLKEKQDERLAA